jgi:zinc transport system permease protein
MIEAFLAMASLSFLRNALIVGVLVSLCAALLGVSLVLKRYSMIGDGLSHVGFGSLAVAAAANVAPLSVAIPVVVLAAFLLLRISENAGIKGDAAVALISTGAMAVGVLVVSIIPGMNVDLSNYMFGSILTISAADVAVSVPLTVVVLTLFILFYHRIFAVTFDENFARATGTNVTLYNMLIAMLTAITIVLGMRMMGTLLISSLIIFPALTAMRVCKRFRAVVVCAACVSVVCFVFGMAASYLYETPAGASIVAANIAAFLLFSLAGFVRRARRGG